MAEYRFILGSASPRRKEIFRMLGLPYEVVVSDAEEIVPKHAKASEVVLMLAKQKARAVVTKLLEEKTYSDWLKQGEEERYLVVLGADTVVAMDDQILGKPSDLEDAKRMLTMLSGREHQVYTGVTLTFVDQQKEQEHISFVEESTICFEDLTEEEIQWYVATGECMDKAGAYAVQGLAARFIKRICGDYWNIVGLPLHACYTAMKSKGIHFE